MKRSILVLSLAFILISKLFAQGVVPDTIISQFNKELSQNPQEKIYLQSDRNIYMSGETIWFRIHLVDALMLKQANASRYVYVTLANPKGELIERVKIRPDSTGCFYGRFRTDEELAEGYYSIEAYTWYMQNMGHDYFFNKKIYITNPDTTSNIKNKDIKALKKTNKAFSVFFFPEGGDAPYSTDIKMAFKAIGTDGMSKEIKGVILDDEKQECASFESSHLGMGYFRMHYSIGKKYYAVCTDTDDNTETFELPKAKNDVVSLNTLWTKNTLRVALAKSPQTTIPTSLMLIAHVRGLVIYAQPWDNTKSSISFSKDFFPAGITHFILIDSNRNILSERLVFSMPENAIAKTDAAFSKESYLSRDKIEMDISVRDAIGNPLSGNFSISVIDKKDLQNDTTSNIVSSLLLTSELKGYIEAPTSYLQDNKGSALALDILMMTQGWRKYNIPQLIKGNAIEQLTYKPELTGSISGKVEGYFSALKSGTISLLAVKDSLLGTRQTMPDEKGRFTFDNLEYPDGTHFIIQALNKKGSAKAFIKLDSLKSYPLPALYKYPPFKKPEIQETYITKMDQKYTIENGMRVYNLADVVVTAKKKGTEYTSSPFYSVLTSKVMTEEDVKNGHFISIFDMLRRLPGVSIVADEVRYKGKTPMVILDNVPEENFDYQRLNVEDIREAFISPAESVAAFYGTAGANGALIINTKKGFVQHNILNHNMQVATPIGYQQSVEFYSPVYDTKEKKESATPDLRTTIYWNPNVRVNENGKAHISFYSADIPTTYEYTIEGVSSTGNIIHSQGQTSVGDFPKFFLNTVLK